MRNTTPSLSKDLLRSGAADDEGKELLTATPDEGRYAGYSPFSRIVSQKRINEEVKAYETYQAQFPFPSVVPPPQPLFSIHGLTSRMVYGIQQIVVYGIWVIGIPIFFLLHLLFLFLDRRQRAQWKVFREQWPHKSVPHERPLVYPTNETFPLEGWHLRCEDGRQRWYYGDPLAEPEEGNELGKAMAAGCTSLEEWKRRQVEKVGMEQARHGHTDPAGRIQAKDTSAPENTTQEKKANLEEEMWERRRFLECYQIGIDPHGKPLSNTPQMRSTAEESMRDGAMFLLSLQDTFSGHWPNDYSGCMFLTPGLLIAKYIIAQGDVEAMFSAPIPGHHHVCLTPQKTSKKKGGRPSAEKHDLHGAEEEGEQVEPTKKENSTSELTASLCSADDDSETGKEPSSSLDHRLGHPSPTSTAVPCRCAQATRSELIRYLRNYQNEDGGFGQHTEGHSTMIGSVLSYISLRLLGVPRMDKAVVACRKWIRQQGGAVWTPTWGKVWLSILGVYSWEGMEPVPPELLLLPDIVPFSLGRSWCHSRVIAIPFSWFYGQRWSAPVWPLTSELREELYVEAYESIPWRSFRSACCATDVFTPPSMVYKLACKLLRVWERHHIPCVRCYALEQCWKHMAYDDENTHFICLGPVNKSLNMLATWIREGSSSARYQLHEERTWDYLYMNRAGMKMSGYNGSQLWDTSFAVQAICAAQLEDQCKGAMQLAHHYVDIAQVQEDPMEADAFYRHRTKGAWNFSTSNQGWQVSDCTAEGLRVLLLLKNFPFQQRRLFDGVDEILSLRNGSGDGGWASYEPTRAPYYVELMNCAELFQDVMVEYSYAECSSSCVHTLSLFRRQYPWYRQQEVNAAIREGIACILDKQLPDGSFYGSWAVCFTYAAWIVSSALLISGELPEMEYHPGCQKLIDFLLAHQNEDGGWGEDINSCVRGVWTDSPDGSQIVNTAWAAMAIMSVAGDPDATPYARKRVLLDAVTRGIHLIMSRQLNTGDWPQERISGVFNGNNPIHYPGYKNSMTVWALGKYVRWEKQYTLSRSGTSIPREENSKKIQ